jgi:long-chain acyl-CoA synthetase
MSLEPILKHIRPDTTAEAIVDGAGSHTYAQLHELGEAWKARLNRAGLQPHAVVSIESDYSAESIAALLALAAHRCILVPISNDSAPHRDAFIEIAQVECRVQPESGTIMSTGHRATHPYYDELRSRMSPGLVLFTSGSTGHNKAAVHDLDKLAAKFATPKRRFRTLVFLQPDHIGGINTLAYTLSNAGTLVLPLSRQPEHVCDLIDACRVELLPTSPTFLTLLLLAFDPSRHTLASLKHITYGTEPMPATTLERVRARFPHVRLQQTYGLTEVGILRSQSREDGSLWVRLGGEGFDLQVREGRLWIKAESQMLGYLNAPSPFSSDGYLDTGDRVEVEGEWFRILGRDSESINVGGSKVLPGEVEDVILQMPEICDVRVRGEKHPFTGQIVVAEVRLKEPAAAAAFKPRLRKFCSEHLPAFKVPVRIVITDLPLHGARFKKQGRHG